MKDGIFKIVKDFIGEKWREGRPLLVAFSGGPDSLALLHLLLECRHFYPLDLHLAHIDHGWREESERQARDLEEMAASLGLPFYLKTLEPYSGRGNLEAKAREERFGFFSNLFKEKDFQAVLLGHHADDQAETVLKRVLEGGGGLLSLGGLKPASIYMGMPLWRPLLPIRKNEILGWLDRRGLQGLDDPTNRDPKYMRSRMRVKILPQLAESFGKEPTSSLSRLGRSIHELRDYLFKKIEPLISQIVRNSNQVSIDLVSFLPIEKIEYMALCKYVMEQEGCFFSEAILESSYLALHQKTSRKRYIHFGRELSVDDGCLRILFAVKNLEN